jgi:cutinase
MMKSFVLAMVAATLSLAAPTDLNKRQASQDEFSNGPCRDVIMFFARGTTEPGNMVSSISNLRQH